MNRSHRAMKSLSHEMKAWGFEEKTDFEGLVPKANKRLPVVGKELEVADVYKIMNPTPYSATTINMKTSME